MNPSRHPHHPPARPRPSPPARALPTVRALSALFALLATMLLPTPARGASDATPAAASPPFEAIVAFGDSLTDTGNEPAEPALHYEGRWSNGPLWIEHLSWRFGLDYAATNNFAHSGAQCDDTYRQVTNFVPRAGLDLNRTLFVVWAGGNDFLQEYDHLWFDDAGWSDLIHASVGHLSNSVVHLHGLGARSILVPNTVDVTEIPTINYLPGFLREYLRDQVNLFNRRLSNALAGAQATLPGIRVFRSDVYRQMKILLRNGKAYGFTEVNIDALADARLIDKSFDGPGAQYLFWDPIHPTTKAHALIADAFHAAVAPMPPALALATSANPNAAAGPGAAGAAGPWWVRAGPLHVTKTYTLEAARPAIPPSGGPPAPALAWSNHLSFVAVSSNAVVPLTNPPAAPALFRLRFTP